MVYRLQFEPNLAKKKDINTPGTVYILKHNLILPNTDTTHPSTQRKTPTIILNQSINRSSRREENRREEINTKEQLILFFFFPSSPTLTTYTQQPLLSRFYQSIHPRFPLPPSISHSQKSRAQKEPIISLTTSRSVLSLRRNPHGVDRALCIADSAWCRLYNKQTKKDKISLAMWVFFFLVVNVFSFSVIFKTHLQTNLRIGRIHFTLVTGSRAGSSIGKTMLFAMSKEKKRRKCQ